MSVIAAAEIDVKRWHRSYNCRHRVDRIRIDERLVLRTIVAAKSPHMYDLHLLDDGRLAALASSQQQQLDFGRRRDAFGAQLPIDLLGAFRHWSTSGHAHLFSSNCHERKSGRYESDSACLSHCKLPGTYSIVA